MATVLSIDYDFFLYNPGEARNASSRDSMLYDWSANESQSAIFQNIAWQSRYAAIRADGRDPIVTTGIRIDKGCVSFERFAHEIGQRLGHIDDAPLWYSDSHAHAIHTVRAAYQKAGKRALTILNFDSHHDLGYTPEAIGAMIEAGAFECGSWLFQALHEGLADRVRVIYPDWKGTGELKREDTHKAHWLKPYRRKIKFMTWSEWLATAKPQAENALYTHVCRSSAWTPPWHDALFPVLLDALPQSSRSCLDCSPCFTKIGAHNACQPRGWDVLAGEKLAHAFPSQLEIATGNTGAKP